MPQELFPKPGDLFWTPADWAWIGGLFDVLLPSLHHGVPVLAHRTAKFDPESALRLMAECGVRNAFLPPTALKMLRAVPDPARFGQTLRSVGSGGETLGEELLDWGRAAFGCAINEFYGQTECNLVVSNCASVLPVQAGQHGARGAGARGRGGGRRGPPRCRPERAGHGRRETARPGDVSRLLEQPGGHRSPSSPATGCSPATRARRMGKAISASSGATTT